MRDILQCFHSPPFDGHFPRGLKVGDSHKGLPQSEVGFDGSGRGTFSWVMVDIFPNIYLINSVGLIFCSENISSAKYCIFIFFLQKHIFECFVH